MTLLTREKNLIVLRDFQAGGDITGIPGDWLPLDTSITVETTTSGNNSCWSGSAIAKSSDGTQWLLHGFEDQAAGTVHGSPPPGSGFEHGFLLRGCSVLFVAPVSEATEQSAPPRQQKTPKAAAPPGDFILREQVMADMIRFGLDPAVVFGSAELAAAELAEDLAYSAKLWTKHTKTLQYPYLNLKDEAIRPGGFFMKMLTEMAALFGSDYGDLSEAFVHVGLGSGLENTNFANLTSKGQTSMSQHPDFGDSSKESDMCIKPVTKIFFDGADLPSGRASICFKNCCTPPDGCDDWEPIVQDFDAGAGGPSGHACGGKSRGVFKGRKGNGVEHDPSMRLRGVVMTIVCMLRDKGADDPDLDRGKLAASAAAGSTPLPFAQSGMRDLLTVTMKGARITSAGGKRKRTGNGGGGGKKQRK